MSEVVRELFASADPENEAQIIAELSGVGVGGGERRDSPFRGTKGLMLAILEDAIRAYLGASAVDRAKAESWIRARSGYVFSFVVICETLGLGPDAVLGALRRFRSAQASPRVIGRSRPNSRKPSRVKEAVS